MIKMRLFAALVLVALLWCSKVEAGDKVPKVLPDPDGKEADMTKKVKVFILLGQSNMLGSGSSGSLKNATGKGLYPYLVDGDGNWTVRNDVRNVRVGARNALKVFYNEWMTLKGRNIGPEIGIGHHLGHAVKAPVLILKSCTGNRSLGWDLLPPGSKQYEFEGRIYAGYGDSPESWAKGTVPKRIGWHAGLQYDVDVRNAKEVLANLGTYYPGAKGYEVAGFCWWQGDKDFRNRAHSAMYEKNLVALIKQLRKEFNAPKAKFVIATLGQTRKGAGGTQGQIIKAMFAVDGDSGKYPEFKGNVKTFYSNPVSKGGSSSGHYGGNAETYMNVGEGMGRLMAELLVADAKPDKPAKPRKPRKLPKATFTRMQAILLKTLVKMSTDGELKEEKILMKGTKREVWLKAADEDGTLTYQMLNSKKKPRVFQLEKLTKLDHAYLAGLVTKLKPDSKDAKAMAGVFYEAAGDAKIADEFYGEAGYEARAKFEKLFGK